jgi:LPXTG-motif cell wall-anchored protein
VGSDVEAANRAAWMQALAANASSAQPAQPESAVLAAEATAPAAPASSLPRTGVASDLLTVLGAVLVGTGFVLVQRARRSAVVEERGKPVDPDQPLAQVRRLQDVDPAIGELAPLLGIE